jgi:hypothetical protein
MFLWATTAAGLAVPLPRLAAIYPRRRRQRNAARRQGGFGWGKRVAASQADMRARGGAIRGRIGFDLQAPTRCHAGSIKISSRCLLPLSCVPLHAVHCLIPSTGSTPPPWPQSLFLSPSLGLQSWAIRSTSNANLNRDFIEFYGY